MSRLRVRVCVGTAMLVAGSVLPAAAAPQSPATPTVQAPATPKDAEVARLRAELDRLKAEFDALRRTYDDRLLQLEQRLTQIGGGPMALMPPATSETRPAEVQQSGQSTQAQPPPAQAAQQPEPPQQPAPTPQSGKVFNPDISVNGNFVAAAGRNPFAEFSPLQLSEVEAAFQAVVDPYARADFFLAASSEGFEVEEGYITFTALPANLLLKVGKLRANFGKMNTLHTHTLPSVDRPLVTSNLVGGDEGLSDAGISVSHLVNNPYLYLEFTGEVFAGHSEVFQSVKRSNLVYVGRARGYHDFNDSSNLDVGTSFAFGQATVDVPQILSSVAFAPEIQAAGLDKRMFGIDATFRYRPPSRAIYRRLNIRTELIWSHQDMPQTPTEKAFGAYVSGEYQFARRWYIGGRIDRSGRAQEAAAIDKGGSAFLTFWPTEFSQIRGQFRHISFAEGVKANEFLLQFNFSIGAHAAHVF